MMRALTIQLILCNLIFVAGFVPINGQENYKLYTYQISTSQNSLNSDSLKLQGTIGSNFYQSSSGDSFNIKGGFWQIASHIFSKPPTLNLILEDTITNGQTPTIARVNAVDMNGISFADLNIQQGGEERPVVIPMTSLNDTIFEIFIPDSLITINNFRVNVVSEDKMGNSSKTEFKTPAMEFTNHELTMSAAYSFYPDGVPSEKWRMIAWPGILDNNSIKQSDLKSGYIFYDWEPNYNRWEKPKIIIPGKAYWFKHKYEEKLVFKNAETEGIAVPLKDYHIKLRKGWNMIGNPFAFPVTVEFDPGQTSGLYSWGDSQKDGWEGPSTKIYPWAGYAVHTKTNGDSITLQPFIENVAARKNHPGWSFKVNLDSDHYYDHAAIIGRLPNAEKEIDNYDRPILPKLDKYLMITFDPDNSGKFLYSGDFRSINETNGTWNARITQRGPKVPIELTGRFTGPYPDDLHVSYVDIQRRLIYKYTQDLKIIIDDDISRGYDFKFIAGDEQYVNSIAKKILEEIPSKYSLSQNYPNPFNPVTNIDFALPKRSQVKIIIYNMLGQKIFTLLDKELDYGRYTVAWNGRNQFGGQVSTGVYLVKFQSREFFKTRKMVFLK